MGKWLIMLKISLKKNVCVDNDNEGFWTKSPFFVELIWTPIETIFCLAFYGENAMEDHDKMCINLGRTIILLNIFLNF